MTQRLLFVAICSVIGIACFDNGCVSRRCLPVAGVFLLLSFGLRKNTQALLRAIAREVHFRRPKGYVCLWQTTPAQSQALQIGVSKCH